MSPKEHNERMTGVYKRGGTFWCWHKWAINEIVGLAQYKECSKCKMRVASELYAGYTRGSVNVRWADRLTDNIGDYGPKPSQPPPAPRKR